MFRDLISACIDGNIDEVKKIIEAGGSVKKSNRDGWTPLYIASCNGHLDVVKILIALGGLVNKANKDGWTPIWIASCNGHLEIVKVLIKAGGLVNLADNYFRTPLYIASCNGHLEIVKVLIASKGNLLFKKSDGRTPLDIAKTDEIKQIIMNDPWYRRHPLLLTRPYSDHKTNKKHKLSPLGEIVTATGGNDPDAKNNLLFQIKIKIASFL